MPTDPQKQISQLLKLKRYEQPPAGFHEKFLADFHRRQRIDSMRGSKSEALWDFLCGLWPNFEVPRYAYATVAAVAVVGVVGIFSIPQDQAAPSLAASTPAVQSAAPSDFPLIPARPVTIQSSMPASSTVGDTRHYVLQPTPASNDQPLSF